MRGLRSSEMKLLLNIIPKKSFHAHLYTFSKLITTKNWYTVKKYQIFTKNLRRCITTTKIYSEQSEIKSNVKDTFIIKSSHFWKLVLKRSWITKNTILRKYGKFLNNFENVCSCFSAKHDVRYCLLVADCRAFK